MATATLVQMQMPVLMLVMVLVLVLVLVPAALVTALPTELFPQQPFGVTGAVDGSVAAQTYTVHIHGA